MFTEGYQYKVLRLETRISIIIDISKTQMQDASLQKTDFSMWLSAWTSQAYSENRETKPAYSNKVYGVIVLYVTPFVSSN